MIANHRPALRPVGRSVGRSWIGFALAALASAALSACGGDPASDPTSGSTTSVSKNQTYLVAFADGEIPANAEDVIRASGGTLVTKYQNVGLVLARGNVPTFATSLRTDTRVLRVGLASVVSSSLPKPSGAKPPALVNRSKGGDALSNRQWDMDQIHAPAAHAISNGKSTVLVGVLDSGVDPTHPDLVGQVNAAASTSCVGGVAATSGADWSNDVFGHGTHVSGIIAGRKNGTGIIGVAPGVKIAAVKVAIDDLADPNAGLIFADAFVCAIDWAIGHNFDVMNSSLSIDPFTGPIDDLFCTDEPDRVAVVSMVRTAVQKAANKKIPLIASAANNFANLDTLKGQTPGSTCQYIPVQLPKVIGVSAVGVTKKLSNYSDYGFSGVDVAGPGGDNLIPFAKITDTTASGQVLSSVPEGSLFYQFAADWNGQLQDCSSGTCSFYAYLQGTSQAAPHVTGVAALAISRFGKMSPEALQFFLQLTATSLPCPTGAYDPGMTGSPATCVTQGGRTSFYGAGEIDALAVVK